MSRLMIVGVVVVTASVGSALVGSTTRAETPQSDLSALSAEIRLLRVAVEEAARAQTQTQGLAVYLSAQQSRFVQTASRLDGVRNDLDAAVNRTRELTTGLADAQRGLARATEFRLEYETKVDALKRELALATDLEQRLRAREADLVQAFQQDEATWRELLSRLEQTIKR
ncbi:MAG TPA: hypothetical protein VFO82_13860 [Steroidobacteraceae bacterium]|nr:hypothetical protein [Steroidobacteraceae bacterium]